jgi:hypothetical protein
VDAEVLRDAMLAISGLLCDQVGGPSVRPPQPASVTALAYGSESWPVSTGADRFRRSLYTFSKRTAPFAAYQAFDAPSGETCAVRRERSNTPLQALTLLNDSMFVEMAEALGSDICLASEDAPSRAHSLAYRVWSRPPSEKEVAAILNYVETQRQRIAKGELSPKLSTSEGGRLRPLIANSAAENQADLVAWIMAARALMNTDEAVVKP